MNQNRFWEIIERSRVNVSLTCREGCFAQQLKDIRSILESLSDEEIVSFRDHFIEAIDNAYQWDLWGAAYIIGGGCSDDGFTDFRAWLISMGREVYYSALADPDSLADIHKRLDFDCYFFEAFLGVTLYLRPYELPFNEHPHPKRPIGKNWEYHELANLFPRLTQLHGNVTG